MKLPIAPRAAQLFTEIFTQRQAAPKWDTPGTLAKDLDPRTVQTPALDAIDEALMWAYSTPDAKLIISMPPQEGKSQRGSRRFPLWVLTQNPDARIVIASYEHDTARRWGRTIRDDIEMDAAKLGLRVRPDVSSQSEWLLEGHEGGVFSTGIGGALTGRASDLMIIDDPVKGRKQAGSKVYRDMAWDWWTDSAATRLAPGAPVVMILTRWHQDDLAGRVLAAEDGHTWRVLNIPAEANHRPEKGETDALGRQPGEFMISARGRTREQWEAIKVRSPARTWGSLYQGSPTPDEGNVFPEAWARYEQPMWVVHADGSHHIPGNHRADTELIQSWDLAFKDTDSSDYVVGQVWLRVGVTVYLLDQVRGRFNFNTTLEKIRALSAKWPQAAAKFVEDKANGPAVINALQTTIAGLIPVEPEGSKYARASAVSPYVHSGNVQLPTAELLPNVEELVEESRGFPTHAHDDTIDAMSQAVNQLLLRPLTDEEQDGPPEPEEWADSGYLPSY